MIRVRDDIRVEDVEEPFKGQSVALAYSSAFGGAGIHMTPKEALSLAEALKEKALGQLEARGEPYQYRVPSGRVVTIRGKRSKTLIVEMKTEILPGLVPKKVIWSWKLHGQGEPWESAPEYGYNDSARDVAEYAAEGVVGDGGYGFPIKIEVRSRTQEGPTKDYLFEIWEDHVTKSKQLPIGE